MVVLGLLCFKWTYGLWEPYIICKLHLINVSNEMMKLCSSSPWEACCILSFWSICTILPYNIVVLASKIVKLGKGNWPLLLIEERSFHLFCCYPLPWPEESEVGSIYCPTDLFRDFWQKNCNMGVGGGGAFSSVASPNTSPKLYIRISLDAIIKIPPFIL